MSAAKQLTTLQRELDAAKQVINDLVQEVYELRGQLMKTSNEKSQQPNRPTFRQQEHA